MISSKVTDIFILSDSIKSFIIGVLQGLTEFLPVSSSGHIELAEYFLDFESLEGDNLTFSILLHLATAVSTLIVFRKDIGVLLKGILSFEKKSLLYAGLIILSMIPATIIGYLLEDFFDSIYDENIPLVCISLLFTGGLLLIADRDWENSKNVNPLKAFVIGVFQAVALIPGISRSGSTISTALILGVDRTKAAKFSFLMVLPLILGKVAKDLIDGDMALESFSGTFLPGIISALVVGVLACTWMINIVKQSKLRYFSFYCFGMSAICLLFFYL